MSQDLIDAIINNDFHFVQDLLQKNHKLKTMQDVSLAFTYYADFARNISEEIIDLLFSPYIPHHI